MNKIWFIDSENVGDKWVSLLASVPADDEILVFYTQKSPHMNYRNIRLLKESQKEVTFIECCEGSNALDFQLCTELGFRIHNASVDEMIIVTDDTGFDAVVKYWTQRSYCVRRIPGRYCAEYAEKKTLMVADSSRGIGRAAPKVMPRPSAPAEPAHISETENISVVAAENASAVSAEEALPGEKTECEKAMSSESVQEGASAEETDAGALPDALQLAFNMQSLSEGDLLKEMDPIAKELLFLIGKDNLSELHESLQQLFGGQKASALYNALKTKGAFDQFISVHKPLTRQEKREQYCLIAFSMKLPKEKMPEDFPEFVSGVWNKKKNLNSFRSSLIQKYGKEKSEKYYSLFKAHIKILDKIQ